MFDESLEGASPLAPRKPFIDFLRVLCASVVNLSSVTSGIISELFLAQ